jgi:hypothetical protein
MKTNQEGGSAVSISNNNLVISHDYIGNSRTIVNPEPSHRRPVRGGWPGYQPVPVGNLPIRQMGLLPAVFFLQKKSTDAELDWIPN